MSCDCNRVYAGPNARNSNVLQNIPPTGSAGSGTPDIPMGHGFCWKCFAFWGVVAFLVLLVIREEE